MSDTQVTTAFKAHQHTRQAISLRGLRAQVWRADGVNAKIAVFLTNVVGSMWCAYAFAILAFVGLPAALKPGGEGIISWIAQTFLQLVLLSGCPAHGLARILLLRASWVTSARPSSSSSGGRYMPKRPR